MFCSDLNDLIVPVCKFLNFEGVNSWRQVSKVHNYKIKQAVKRVNTVIEKTNCKFFCSEFTICGNLFKSVARFDSAIVFDVGSANLSLLAIDEPITFVGPNNNTNNGVIYLAKRSVKDYRCSYLIVIHCVNGAANIAAGCRDNGIDFLSICKREKPIHIFDFINEMIEVYYFRKICVDGLYFDYNIVAAILEDFKEVKNIQHAHQILRSREMFNHLAIYSKI